MARILLGITGGIAAYKAVNVVRQLSELGHDVRVIPTDNALRFVGRATLEAISHNPADNELYTDVSDVKHVALGQSADLVVVAPATAAFLARYAAGQADDLLLNALLVTQAPVLIAPAMHTEMWNHPATQANLKTLEQRGVHLLTPAAGRLTGDDVGVGRMQEPADITRAAVALLSPQDLKGRRVLVTAGGTREPIDAVRYIGNHSSGLQGAAIASAAATRGAQVTLIGANMAAVPGVRFIPVGTAAELGDALQSEAPEADVIIAAAAVSDFHVTSARPDKVSKQEVGDEWRLDLRANPDLLARLVRERTGGQYIVGFAAETAQGDSDLIARAVAKLARKGCDLLIANDVAAAKVFGASDNRVAIIDGSGLVDWAQGTKREVADRLLDAILRHI